MLGPWSGWQAACNSLNEEKYEVSLMAIVLLSWNGWQTACNWLMNKNIKKDIARECQAACIWQSACNWQAACNWQTACI